MKKAKKPQTKSKSKRPSETNKLDKDTFNFLENLLVFCVMPERNAPLETGLHFRVSPRESDESLCLLFETDREKDSLFDEGKRKPDYMVFYYKPDLGFCLCTIIEMKGGKNIKGGIEQIKNLHKRLNREIKEHLPNKLKIKFQAIILSSQVSQTPNNLITDESTNELVIRPLPYFQKAELFKFISQEITLTKPDNKLELIRNCREDSFVENVLIRGAISKRVVDEMCKMNKKIANNRDGVYINYNLPNKEDYAALAIDNAGMKIGIKDSNNKFTNRIQSDLKRLGLKSTQHFEIESIK